MRLIIAAAIVLCWLFSVVEANARPRAWCGCYMQQHTGITSQGTGLNLNMAREWARVGSAVSGPVEGAVVVWRHHVGVIVGRSPNGEWLVHSGNDGNAVRTRPRSLRGAIAFRQVGSGFGSAYADLKRQENALRRSDKHLIALAVEGGHRARTAAGPLKKSRARAYFASEMVKSRYFGYTAPFAQPTDRAHKVRSKKGEAVMQRERMLPVLCAPMPDAVDTASSKPFSIHASPHIQLDQAAAGRPSSRALQRLEARRLHASQSWDSDARARAGGAVWGWHASPSGRP